MADSILDIVEQSLLNIAIRYKEFSSNPDVAESDLKGFDEQLNDIMDRYNKLKGLQSTYTAEELTIKLNEFQVLYDDLVLKINSGFFKGADGKSLTFDMLTLEQKESLKGQNGLSAYELASQNGFQGTEAEYLESLKGQDGKDLTFEILTPEQKESLKGQNGLSAYELASQNGFQGTEAEYLESLKGQDAEVLTFDMLTSEQLQQIANLVPAQTVDLTSILLRLAAVETALSITSPVAETEPDYFYPKPFVTDITHNYESSPYTMTISAGYYESEMIDLVESQYINHVIKTNWNVLNWNTNPITVDINCVVSDGLLENPLDGNCVVCNFKFERAFDGTVRVSGGSYYMGQYGEFPPQMETDFVWVERGEDDLLKISLHTDPMGIIKDTFYEMFGTDKLFYKFDIVASSATPLVLSETPITEIVERWSL